MCGGFQDSTSPSRLEYGEQGLEGKEGCGHNGTVMHEMGSYYRVWHEQIHILKRLIFKKHYFTDQKKLVSML